MRTPEPLLTLDLHCHVLPGIDDGPRDLAEAVAVARALVSVGIRHAVATSHITPGRYPNRRDDLLERVADFQDYLVMARVPLRLLPGAEVRLEDESLQPDVRLTIGDGGQYLLVELPNKALTPQAIESQLRDLLAQGLTPILAHPERYPMLQREPALLARWVELGCLAQGTLSVLAGRAAEPAIQALETFLAKGLIHVFGTDAHHVDARLKGLDGAVRRLEALVGPEASQLIRHGNPTALLLGAPIRRPFPDRALASGLEPYAEEEAYGLGATAR